MATQKAIRKAGRAHWKPLQAERRKNKSVKAIASALDQLGSESVRRIGGVPWYSYDGGKTWRSEPRRLAPLPEGGRR